MKTRISMLSNLFSVLLDLYLIGSIPDCCFSFLQYMNTLNYLSSASFYLVPLELSPDLQKMLSANESFRPTAMDFTVSLFTRQCPSFRGVNNRPKQIDVYEKTESWRDVKCSLMFLERDKMQKSEFLKALSDMWKDFDTRVLRYKLVKQAILPRVHGLALKTTVAAVIVNALLCFGDLVSTLDKHAILDILQTIQHCTAVHRSPPTLMCTLGVANSILKQHGVEFVTKHVLPLLSSHTSSHCSAIECSAVCQVDALCERCPQDDRREKRSYSNRFWNSRGEVIIFSQWDSSSSLKQNKWYCCTSRKSSASWDEDWGPVSKGFASAHRALASNSSPTPSISANQPVQSTFLHSESPMTSAVSRKQTAVSCLPVDIEWPPPTSSTAIPHLAIGNKQLDAGATSTSSLNDIDPFADWPPRPSGTSSGPGASNNGTTGPQPNSYSSNMITNTPNIMNLQNKGNTSWAFNNQSSFDPLKPPQGTSAVSSGSLNSGSNPQNSIGFLKQNQNTSTLGSYNNTKSTDLASIFGSSKNEQTAPKLSPPPSTAVGRGRGRGRGGTSNLRSSQAKRQAEQPSLLDLL
ncbi:hypothetical protein SADUNF_Sadunf13G0077800 [Salix dunnii]|uniref:SCY1-like protein 2 n=1 Tax=Salix dunnii TaxID=1413687 RepID=A0A835ML20_9ROSI|nr:hypothetical protein SADUNF_Sadunf13G0077800 [Salix dunnii]